MNIYKLVVQANDLTDRLTQKAYEVALTGDVQKTQRIENLLLKAINRYKRRYEKWQG